MPHETLREELHQLLLDDDQSAAAALAPRMLADPQSLTPELRWCLTYFLRGVRCLAARARLLVPGTLVHSVAQLVEPARLATETLDRHWFEVARNLPGHWLTRYEESDRRYSLEELRWLNARLARLWITERRRLEPVAIPTLANR